MTFRSVVLLLGWGLLLPPACGPDAEPKTCDAPDFIVLISASGGELPADTLVVMIYGSGREEYRLSAAAKPVLLWCTPIDSDGQAIDAGVGGTAPGVSMGGAGGVDAAGGAGDRGGASGSAGSAGSAGATATDVQGVSALRCELWTQGPATLEITAEGYPEYRQELELERGKCTVDEEIEIVHGDAGT